MFTRLSFMRLLVYKIHIYQANILRILFLPCMSGSLRFESIVPKFTQPSRRERSTWQGSDAGSVLVRD
jgi:hypothetical protein